MEWVKEIVRWMCFVNVPLFPSIVRLLGYVAWPNFNYGRQSLWWNPSPGPVGADPLHTKGIKFRSAAIV